MKLTNDPLLLEIARRQLADISKYINTRLEDTRSYYLGLKTFTDDYCVINQTINGRTLQNINISTTFGNESTIDPNIPEFLFRIGSTLRYEKVLTATNKDPFEVVNYQTLLNVVKGNGNDTTDPTLTIGTHTFVKDPKSVYNQYVKFKDINVKFTGTTEVTGVKFFGTYNIVDDDDPNILITKEYLTTKLSVLPTANDFITVKSDITTLKSRATTIENNVTDIQTQLLTIPTNTTLTNLTSRVSSLETSLTGLTQKQLADYNTLSNGKLNKTGDSASGNFTFAKTNSGDKITFEGIDFVSQNNTTTLGVTNFTGDVTVNSNRVIAKNLEVSMDPVKGTDVPNKQYLESRLNGVDAGTIGALDGRVSSLENAFASAFGAGGVGGSGTTPSGNTLLTLTTATDKIATLDKQMARTSASTLGTNLATAETNITNLQTLTTTHTNQLAASTSSGLKTYIDNAIAGLGMSNYYTKTQINSLIAGLTQRINNHASATAVNTPL